MTNLSKVLLVLAIVSCCVKFGENQPQSNNVDKNHDGIHVNDCPLLCSCQGYNVTCSGNILFPEGLPDVMEHFTLQDAHIPDITATSFQNLPRLKSIAITSCHITRIRACSFAELENMVSIVFRNVSVDVLEGNAFSNLNNISRIEILLSQFKVFKSYTFHNLKGIQTFRFEKTSVITFNPYSFRNVSNTRNLEIVECIVGSFQKDTFSHVKKIETFTVARSTIEVLQCESVTKLRDVTSTLDIRDNIFTCDCSLGWMITSSETSYLTDISQNNTCVGPHMPRTDLKDVNMTSVCGSRDTQEQGCPRSWLPSTPYTCTLKFDKPLDPGDKVDYPPEFTTQSFGAGSQTLPTFTSVLILSAACLLL